MSQPNSFDVIIIGGSYAGLSAALALGRSRRNVLIVDAGKPCNAQTPHSHNFLTQDGQTPAQISSIAKSQVLEYPTVKFEQDFVTKVVNENDRFAIETENAKRYFSKRVLLATGVKDVFPDISGLKECWGISALHCPYCHGYEVADSPLAVIANGDLAIDYTKMIHHWSNKLKLFTNGPASLPQNGDAFLKSIGVEVVEEKIAALNHQNGYIKSVDFIGGKKIELDAVFIRVPFEHHSDIAKQLGCSFTEMNHIAVDQFGKTNVAGVYAAGDCTTPMRTVSAAVAAGTMAGVSINKELIELKFQISDL